MAVKPEKQITIVGCGPGTLEDMTPRALAAIGQAQVLVGSARLLELFADHPGRRLVMTAKLDQTLDAIAALEGSLRIAVLVTGDPGVCSLAAPVIRRFGREACQVLPGISSIQLAFARVGLPWWDAKICSLHKPGMKVSVDELRSADKIALLTGSDGAFERIAELAEALGEEREIVVCEELGLPAERVTTATPPMLRRERFSRRTVVLLIPKEVA